MTYTNGSFKYPFADFDFSKIAGEFKFPMVNVESVVEASRKNFAALQKDVATTSKALHTGPDARTKMNAKLRDLLDKIEVFPIGDPNYPHDQALWAYVDEWQPQPNRRLLGRFIDGLVARLQTKEGRFLTLHFKGGTEVVDLVPPGSLARGLTLGPKGNRSRVVRPDLTQLFEDFRDNAEIATRR